MDVSFSRDDIRNMCDAISSDYELCGRFAGIIDSTGYLEARLYDIEYKLDEIKKEIDDKISELVDIKVCEQINKLIPNFNEINKSVY